VKREKFGRVFYWLPRVLDTGMGFLFLAANFLMLVTAVYAL
jgi:hypothetical protein